MNSKTMRAFQKMFFRTKQMFMNSKTTHAFQKMFVLTKQTLMHLKTAQNFKTNVCRLEKMFVAPKVFHVQDLDSFWKFFLCLGARSSLWSIKFIFKVLNILLRGTMKSVPCSGKLIALGFTTSNALRSHGHRVHHQRGWGER